MRTFYIQYGNYQGNHEVYESVKEFRESYPDVKLYQWGREKDWEGIQVGHWIEALDGFVTRVLNVTFGKHYKHLLCKFVKVPMGTFTIKVNMDGNYKWQNLYAGISQIETNSPGLRTRGRKTKVRKLEFARLLSMGISPYNAYIQAGFPYQTSHNILHSKIKGLLMDEDIKEEVSKAMQPYIEKIRTDEAFSDKNMVAYVKDFMLHVRKGSQTHLNSIIPLLTLLGKLPEGLELGNTKTKKEKIQDVHYEEVVPPQQ